SQSAGRFILGLAASTPQLVEGLHDVSFGALLARMRQVVSQVRALLRGERAPLAVAREARALRLNVPPAEVPICVAAIGDASVRLAGEIADGWMPFLHPLRVRQGSAGGARRQCAQVRGRGAAGGRGAARRADRLRHAAGGASAPGALVRGRRRHARADVPPQSYGGADAALAGGVRANARVEVMAMDQPREVTPRERVVAAYKGQRADRVPAYPIAGSFAGCLDGLSIEEYCTNPKKAVKAMINYYERYQPDI